MKKNNILFALLLISLAALVILFIRIINNRKPVNEIVQPNRLDSVLNDVKNQLDTIAGMPFSINGISLGMKKVLHKISLAIILRKRKNTMKC